MLWHVGGNILFVVHPSAHSQWVVPLAARLIRVSYKTSTGLYVLSLFRGHFPANALGFLELTRSWFQCDSLKVWCLLTLRYGDHQFCTQ